MKFNNPSSILFWIFLYAWLIHPQKVAGQTGYHTVRSADGTTIGFTKVGSGSVPVVFVHGALNSGAQWMPVATAMSEYCTCYVMDRWGRGGSDNRTNYSINSEAENILAVLEVAGPDAVLLGHSSGAIYALEVALKAPLAALILYEPPIHAFHERFVEDVWDSIRIAAEEERFEDVVSIFLTDEAGLSGEGLEFLQSTPLWDQMVSLAPQTVREWAALVQEKPTVELYQDITVPTLLLTGTETENHPSFATQALDATLPNTRIIRLKGQEHTANLSAPEMVAKEITKFILETTR